MSQIFSRALGIVAAVAAVGAWSGCSPGSENKTIVVTGASTIAPLMSEVGKRFEERHPGVRVDVQTGGSARGVNDARQGLNDIGMVSRSANPDEQDLRMVPIALDGVTMIVHSSNPVKELNADQVRSIYRKEVTNWSQVGGEDRPITVVNKAEGRSTLELFLKYFKMEPTEIKADVIVGDNEQDIKSVATDPSAIGYVSIGTTEFEMKRGTTLKGLPLEGIEPTSESVRSGKFPLQRPLNLATTKPPEGLTKELIEFAASPEVRDLVEAQFFVPLGTKS